jgi:hypothetical protein
MRSLLGLALTALALLAAGCGSDNGDGAEGGNGDGTMTVELQAQNDSGQSGEASLTEVDDATTRVEVVLSDPPSETQPAHIHEGSCADLNPQPAHALESLGGGTSTSEVQVSLDELQDGNFAINVHKSDAEIETYVACGDIASGPGGTETGETETETGTDDYGY